MTTTLRAGRRRRTTTLLGTALLALTVAAMLGASGCVSVTRTYTTSRNTISMAEYLIHSARDKNADAHAAEEMATARDKLTLAQQALKDGHPDYATRLAEEAIVTAQLASALADRQNAELQLAEARRVKQETGALRRETLEATKE